MRPMNLFAWPAWKVSWLVCYREFQLRTASSPNLGLLHPRTVVKALKSQIFFYKRKFDFMARVVGEMGMAIKIAHLPYCIMF
jgi:hypothetical protein